MFYISNGEDAGAPFQLKLGIYRNPHEFIAEAQNLRHPIDSPSFLPEALIQNIFAALTNSAPDITKMQLEKIRLMRTWALELESQNLQLIRSLDVPIAKILCTKNLLLMKKVLDHINYPDKNLIEDIVKGTEITGEIPMSGVFPPRRVPATASAQTLLDASPSVRNSVIARIVSSGDPEIDAAVWEETGLEVNRQWLSAEMTLDEIQEAVGPLFVIAKRFGIKQSGKVRAIDDYSISGGNAAATSTEKLDLLGNDEMFALLKLIISSIDEKETSS